MKSKEQDMIETTKEVRDRSDALAKIITNAIVGENTTPCLLALLKVECSIVEQLLRDAPEHVVAWHEIRAEAYSENFDIDL
jgi:hypothetical protein